MASIRRGWKPVLAPGQEPHRRLALLTQPAAHAGVRDHVVEEAGDDLDQPLGPRRRHLGLDVVERAAGERPDDLDQQMLARADPAVERHAIHAELVGEPAHVDALAGQEAFAREAEGVERGRARM